jgi:hypothetical protein
MSPVANRVCSFDALRVSWRVGTRRMVMATESNRERERIEQARARYWRRRETL